MGGGRGTTERKWGKTITKTRVERGRTGAGKRGMMGEAWMRGVDDRLVPTSMSIRATCAKTRRAPEQCWCDKATRSPHRDPRLPLYKITHAHTQAHRLISSLEHVLHTCVRACTHLKNSPVTDAPQLVHQSWRAAGGPNYGNRFAL